MKKIALMYLAFFTPFLFAQWEPEIRLTFDDSTSYTSINNARWVSAEGNIIHAVWYDHRDGNDEIYYKRSTDDGTNWGADTRLTDEPQTSAYPSIATSGDNIHIVWFDGRDFNWEIYYKRSTDGGLTWEPDTGLTLDPANSQFTSVAVSGTNVHVVWREERDGNLEIYYKRSTDNGTTWESDIRLTSNTARSVEPTVAASESYVHVAWSDDRDTNWEIYYKRSTDGGVTWEPDMRFTNNPTRSEFNSIAVSGSNVHVVWQNNYDIYHRRSTDDGLTWEPDTALTDFGLARNPSIVSSGNNLHVVWFDYRDSNYEIYYKRSTDNGITWEPDTRLTDNAFFSARPSATCSDSGVHVIFYEDRDGNYEIYYKRNPTGNPGVQDRSYSTNISEILFVPTIFRDRIKIRFTQPSEKRLHLTLYNIYGAKLWEKSYSNTPSSLVIHDAEIRRLPAAVYFLFVSSDKRKFGSVKLIKQ